MISLFFKNKKQPPLFPTSEPEADFGWIDQTAAEGELQVDVYQNERQIIIKSTAAGVKPEDLSISLNGELLTIRGRRESPDNVLDDDYLCRECYWGSFSRSLLLPVAVDQQKIEAYLENGVLTIVLTKTGKPKKITVKVKE
jgi:HSP20 family protein